MIKEIHGAPHDLRIAAFKNWDLLDEVEALDAVANAAWGEIYEGIRSGSYRIAYWDGYTVERPEYHSFMRYALHRSTKRDGFLQLSVAHSQSCGLLQKRNHFFRLRFLNLNLVLTTLIPFTISTIWYFSRYCALCIPILSACLGLSATVSAVYREPLPISAPPFIYPNCTTKD